MRWWVFASLATIGLVLVVVAIGVGLAMYTASHPMGPEADQARGEKVGQIVGLFLVLALGGVWGYAYVGLRNRRSS